MQQFQLQRTAITGLAALAIFYCLAVLWYVPTQPCIPLNCLLSDSSNEPEQPGLEIQDVSLLKGIKSIPGNTPEVGDRIIAAAGQPIRSFADWAKVHRRLRNWKIDSAAQIPFGKDPTEQSTHSSVSVFAYPDQSKAVLVWFTRKGHEQPLIALLPLVAQPTADLSVTLLWYVLELCVVIIGGVAYWNRPFDKPLRTFFALSALTLVAFVGGSHWWLIAASPLLILVFAIAGCLLPATLLHFFLTYPFPGPLFSEDRKVHRWMLYVPPALAAIVLSTMILSTSFLTVDAGPGPFAKTLSRLTGEIAKDIFPWMRQVIYVVFGMGVLYFLGSLMAIRRSHVAARNPIERNQVQSLMWAAGVASLLIAYTIYMAITDHTHFALGGARLPMFGASLAFMLAYAVGIARYKLLLIDQVVSRGVWYYSGSAVLTLFFASLIAVGAVNTMHRDISLFGQTLPIILVVVIAVLVLIWLRDSIQRKIDRHYFSEKYQLDKALNRMNRVVSNLLEPEAVADSLLNSCREVLRAEYATLYLRKGHRLEFRMFTTVGNGNLPLQMTLNPEVLEALEENMVLQRVPHSSSPTQLLLRQLQAEVIHGLEIQNDLSGLLVLGAKGANAQFSAEDLAFVDAMARISGVAMHCATVQQDVSRLNQDLQLKLRKIEDQERQLSVLHGELASLSKGPVVANQPEMEFRREWIKGQSPAITDVLNTVRKVASSNSSVLIRGESGTGKELLAKALHENSTRRDAPLVVVHCAALSPALLESELFGHVKGAFTDARNDKVGRFQLAHGGTLFLDEIGDISLDVQVKLLRVLQERQFEPVGSNQTISVDVRIVAATHRNLEELISEGKFREDLFYRLNVISVTLPPLRERPEDLYELALHFLRKAAEECGKGVIHIDDDAMKLLESHDWPGNIRELQNVIERAVVLCEGTSIRLRDLSLDSSDSPRRRKPQEALPRTGKQGVPTRLSQISLRRKTIADDVGERAMLEEALESCQGNKAEAARSLGMPRSTFFSKLKKHGLG